MYIQRTFSILKYEHTAVFQIHSMSIMLHIVTPDFTSFKVAGVNLVVTSVVETFNPSGLGIRPSLHAVEIFIS